MELPMNISKATIKDIPHLEKLINSAYRGEESKKGWTTEADLLEGKRISGLHSEGKTLMMKQFISKPETA